MIDSQSGLRRWSGGVGGGLSQAHGAWGLTEGDLEGATGGGTLISLEPLTQVTEAVSDETFTASRKGWRLTCTAEVQKKKKKKAVLATAPTVNAEWKTKVGVGKCVHGGGEEVKRY